MQNQNGQMFREDEVVIMTKWSSAENREVSTIFPKVSGRLRVAHESNQHLSIETDLVKYDGQVAVVNAKAITDKGTFRGTGMSSVDRDQRIAPAIIELAETRAVARALRFSGVGHEFCSFEEISHLENGTNGKSWQHQTGQPQSMQSHGNGPTHIGEVLKNSPLLDNRAPSANDEVQSQGVGNAGSIPNTQNTGTNGNYSNPGQGGNGGSRLSHAQMNFIVNLGRRLKWDSKRLNREAEDVFNTSLEALSVRDASSFIDHLKGKMS